MTGGSHQVPRLQGARAAPLGLQVVTINRSCWPGVKDALGELDDEVGIVLVQEHKLDQAHIDSASAALYKMGWGSVFSKAATGQAGFGSAGVAILARLTLGLRDAVEVADTRAIAAQVDVAPGRTLAVMSVYGAAGRSEQHATTDMLQKVAAFAQVTQAAVGSIIIGGDWNLTPCQLQHQGWPQEAGITVLAPTRPTSKPRPSAKGRFWTFSLCPPRWQAQCTPSASTM